MARFLILALLASPLLLTACSAPEWEAVQVNQARTAGGVVSYVRAKILPKQELKLVPAVAPIDEEHSEAVEVMQKMFREHQQK